MTGTSRRHGIAPNLFYCWKDETEQAAKAGLGGRSAGAWATRAHRVFRILLYC
jgi:hypothetical protein